MGDVDDLPEPFFVWLARAHPDVHLTPWQVGYCRDQMIGICVGKTPKAIGRSFADKFLMEFLTLDEVSHE